MVECSPMPIHDWTRVEAGVFRHFHHGWISAIARTLNHGLLPPEYYALIQKGHIPSSWISICRESSDQMASLVHIGSHDSSGSFDILCWLLDHRVNLLLAHLLPQPSRCLPKAIWERKANSPLPALMEKSLAVAAFQFEAGSSCYFEPVNIGDRIPEVPLFLEPGAHVLVPLDKTYQDAYADVPARWQRVLEA
jgi:hypothetical protein